MLRPLLVALLLAAPALSAQETPPAPNIPAPAPPIPRARLTGKIVCNDTRQPARGAMVLLQPLPSKYKTQNAERPSMLIARTGLDGSYTLDHIVPGDYAVVAFLPGYLSPFDGLVIGEGSADPETEIRSRVAGSNLVHIARDTPQTADLVLERGATIAGRILYSDGAPATQSTIELEDVSAKPAVASGQPSLDMGAIMRTMFTHQSLSTDDTGHFRVSGIHPGTYRIAVAQPVNIGDMGTRGGDSAMAMSMISGMADPHALRVYAGDTLHRKSAKTYELRAGDTLDGLDIRIPIDGFHPVRVKLTAIDGRPLTRADLTLVDNADDTLTFTAVNRQEGVFEFNGVPAGTYTLTAKSGFIGQMYQPPTAAFADGATAVLIKDSDPAEVVLALKEIPLPKPEANTPVPQD